MNKIKFIKNPRISQVIIKSQKGQMLDDRGIYVITNNQLKGLIKVNIEQKNANSFKLVYTTTGFITLKEHLKNTMNKDAFARLLQNILGILQSIQNAGFYHECVLFDINYVFVNPSTQNVFLIYVPVQNFEGGGTLRDFLLSVVQNISSAQGEDSSYIHQFVGVLSNKPNFSAYELRDYVSTLSAVGATNFNAKCPRCGTPISDNIKFCAGCGAKLTALTGDFRQPQISNPSLAGSAARRGDSPPIDLMGIPERPPQLKTIEPPVSNSGSQKNGSNPSGQKMPPRSKYAPNGQGVPPQSNYIPNGQGVPPQSNYIPNGQGMPPQSNYIPNGQGVPPQSNYIPNGKGMPPQSDYIPNGQGMPPQSDYIPNGQGMPPQSNYIPNGKGMPPQSDYIPNGQGMPPQSDISSNGLEYDLSEPSANPNSVNIPENDPYLSGTVVLTDNSPKPTTAYLIRISTGEKTAVDKPQFVVGRMLGHVDYCVVNNSAVGRQHLKITSSGGRYFICDLNSTNGTYIDEHQIPKNVDTEVFSGAKITLANEDFKFIIE